MWLLRRVRIIMGGENVLRSSRTSLLQIGGDNSYPRNQKRTVRPCKGQPSPFGPSVCTYNTQRPPVNISHIQYLFRP